MTLQSVNHPAPVDVVLVHGAGGNSLLWKRTQGFMEGPATSYAIDLPGHPQGEISCTSISCYAESVIEFLSDMHLDRPVVCGHSMGSAVALRLVIDHPESVRGAVLVGAGAKLGVDKSILDGLDGKPIEAIERIITPRSFYSIDLGLGREARQALSLSNLPVFLNDYLACNGFDVRADLPRIRAPVLVVCGDRDEMTPPKWAHYLNQNILGSELRLVRDAGHMLPLEKPEALAGVLSSFLSSFTR